MDAWDARMDERELIAAYLRACAERYPADVFPSLADGGDATGNAGAAARHVLNIAAQDVLDGRQGDDG